MCSSDLLAVEVREAQLFAVVEWGAAPWRVTRRARPGRAGSQRPQDVIVARTLGAEELAPWRVAHACYLRRWL